MIVGATEKGGITNLAIEIDIGTILFALILALTRRVHNGFIYNHLELLRLTLYVWLSLMRALAPSLLLLAVAILNKETAILLPFIGAAILFSLDKTKSSELPRGCSESLVQKQRKFALNQCA